MFIFAYLAIVMSAFLGGHWILGSLMILIGAAVCLDMKGIDNGS